jgi:hydrogenase nickel incorporation protein HypA/HybF
MHEARVIRKLVAKVDAVAKENDAPRVDTVRLEIGADSHITSESLSGQFAVFAQGSTAEHAELDILTSEDRNTAVEFDVRLVSIVLGD